MEEENVYGSTLCMKDGGLGTRNQDKDVKLVQRVTYTLAIGNKAWKREKDN